MSLTDPRIEIMNSRRATPKRLVIVGATGMVGGYALRFALEDPRVGQVTSIGRRKVGISHPKLSEVLHQDFAKCAPLSSALAGQDAALFCLGAYTGSVSDAQLRTITAYHVENWVGALEQLGK
jgi:putative NADH-flavin reductase